jgi:photosystem II stability/assembly factor-like uncharacterized protein
VAICSAVIGTFGLAAPANIASAATTTNTQVLYAGHGVGIVATYDLNTGCSEVFLSTDMTTWRNITPPLKIPADIPKGQCEYVWSSADFVSPTDGWLLARNEGGTGTILRHTVDGGRTWIAQPGGDTGSNAGSESISFVTAALGWRQQFAFGSNTGYSLERTLNGGTTWETRSPSLPHGSCMFANDVFATATLGVAFVTRAPTTNDTHLWRTSDGGVDWSLMTFVRPPLVSSTALGLYGEPFFSGINGVVPVDYPDGNRQAVYFYVTHDGGQRWNLDGAKSRVIVGGTLQINHQGVSTKSCSDLSLAPISSGDVAMITSAGPTTWWILQPGVKGKSAVTVATLTDGKRTSTKISDLPTTRSATSFAALSSTGALLTVPIPHGYQSTYETSNGGRTWSEIELPTPRASPPGSG